MTDRRAFTLLQVGSAKALTQGSFEGKIFEPDSTDGYWF